MLKILFTFNQIFFSYICLLFILGKITALSRVFSQYSLSISTSLFEWQFGYVCTLGRNDWSGSVNGLALLPVFLFGEGGTFFWTLMYLFIFVFGIPGHFQHLEFDLDILNKYLLFCHILKNWQTDGKTLVKKIFLKVVENLTDETRFTVTIAF